MLPYDLIALAASVCWAFGGILAAPPSRHFGPFTFTRLRLTLLTVLLGATSWICGGWQSLTIAGLWPILLSGLIAAFCQALGTFFAKPAMDTGLDPVTASALRIGVSCGAHYLLLLFGARFAASHRPYTTRMLLLTAINGIVTMGLGMTFIMIALQKANVAAVGILSALSPVLILPMLWLVMKKSRRGLPGLVR